MKTLTFPDRTELISERGVLGMLRLVAAARSLTKRKKASLVSIAGDRGLSCLIVRDLPKVGETIQLTEGETAPIVIPRRLAKELAADVEHSPDCQHRRPGPWLSCSCAATLTLRKRNAGH
jgi:hypothetical protein